jgi:hypothetical protein
MYQESLLPQFSGHFPASYLHCAAGMTQYIRLKRKKETVFLHVEPFDSFGTVKQRLGTLYSIEPEKIQLFADDKKREMADLATVSDQGRIIFFLSQHVFFSF